jgi:hypothetical protein
MTSRADAQTYPSHVQTMHSQCPDKPMQSPRLAQFMPEPCKAQLTPSPGQSKPMRSTCTAQPMPSKLHSQHSPCIDHAQPIHSSCPFLAKRRQNPLHPMPSTFHDQHCPAHVCIVTNKRQVHAKAVPPPREPPSGKTTGDSPEGTLYMGQPPGDHTQGNT